MPSSLIQVAPSGRYFQFRDGTPFMPIGHNTHADFLEVFGYQGRYEPDHVVEERIQRLVEHGGNYLRLFVSNRLEEGYFQTGKWHEPTVKRLDLLFRLAEQYEVYYGVELVISQYFAQWYCVDQWPYSPYNAVNGGPVVMPPEADDLKRGQNKEAFRIRHRLEYGLENEVYVAAQKAKFKWFVDRYGGNPHVFNWGLSNDFPWSGNEPDPAEREQKRSYLEPWLETMANWIRDNDKHGHMISLQLGSGSVWPAWMRKHLDFTSIRAYPWSDPSVYDDAVVWTAQPERHALSLANHLARKAAEHWAYRMPTICGEYGGCADRDWESFLYSPTLNLHSTQRSTLYGLWVPLATGAMPGHRWTGHDGFYPLTKEEYGYLKAVSEFCAGVNWATYDPQPIHDSLRLDDQRATVWGIDDGQLAIGFVLCQVPEADGTLALTLAGEALTGRTVRFLDPRTNRTVGEPAPMPADGAAVPAFDDCIAFTAKR